MNMKKLLSVLLCLLLLSVLTLPVFAEQTATMTVKASKTQLKPGDKVTFTVSVTEVDNCTFGGFKFSYDKAVFDYVSGKSMAGLSGFLAGVSTAANNVAGFFMNGIGTVKGDLFSVTMQMRDDAKNGTYTVDGKPSLTGNDGAITCTAQGVQVTVTEGSTTPNVTKPTTPSVPIPTVTLPQLEINGVQQEQDGTQPEDTTPVEDPTIEPDTQPTTASQPDAPQQEGDPEKPSFPWWIVVLIVVLAAGGTAFLVIEIKRMKKS